jgi:hypothetical protein
MYMWNKDWPQFVALGQHVIDGRNRGNLSDDDMVGGHVPAVVLPTTITSTSTARPPT